MLYGSVHPARHGLAQGASGEFQCGSLTLEEPRVAVGVEDAFAEQIVEGGLPRGAFWVVVEAKLEDVLEVFGVARDSHQALFSGEEGEGADAGLVRAAARAEVVSDPVVHAVGVLDEAREAAQ